MGTDLIDLVQPTDAVYSRLEQDLYTALLVATETQQKKVYFLAGHGERDINRAEEDGYQQIRDGLAVDNYAVGNAGLVAVARGRNRSRRRGLAGDRRANGELPPGHADALNFYMAGKQPDGAPRREGARLIFLAEPDTHDTFRAFLAFWGVVVTDGYIRDVKVPSPTRRAHCGSAFTTRKRPPKSWRPGASP